MPGEIQEKLQLSYEQAQELLPLITDKKNGKGKGIFLLKEMYSNLTSIKDYLIQFPAIIKLLNPFNKIIMAIGFIGSTIIILLAIISLIIFIATNVLI